MEDILVPIALFAIIPFIVWAVSAYRYKSHAQTISLLDTMANKGEPITTDLVKTLGVRRKPKHADLRLGLILIAVAVSTVIFGGAVDDAEAARIFAAIASFPFLVGLVFLALWFAITRKDED
ncbi:hypothetical protein GCM10007853_23400 [Algimonas ampicilliniresistens]|jgi:uncharacterized membrane protein YfcA|uniref:DUF6249 domain-containing protein n=1 Tax=Algimonas ampicilliniresistens TaxID=1298735 RepID=A0ABQ5VAB1_9PROT|nr:DUF6249 domain-containing protein [Algimonas ampicilliniresistens]GLQ24466.1 hypothetical protein GCM10007853_23400 [Algimonas ampicilliniresistens]